MKRVFRFATWRIRQEADPTYNAECVGNVDCRAESKGQASSAALDKWMCQHTEETGHVRFVRNTTDHAVTVPPEYSDAAQHVAQFPDLESSGATKAG